MRAARDVVLCWRMPRIRDQNERTTRQTGRVETLTRVVRVFDTEQVRLLRPIPTFIVLVKVTSATFQGDPGLVVVEVFAVQFEKLDKEETNVAVRVDLRGLDPGVELPREESSSCTGRRMDGGGEGGGHQYSFSFLVRFQEGRRERRGRTWRNETTMQMIE